MSATQIPHATKSLECIALSGIKIQYSPKVKLLAFEYLKHSHTESSYSEWEHVNSTFSHGCFQECLSLIFPNRSLFIKHGGIAMHTRPGSQKRDSDCPLVTLLYFPYITCSINSELIDWLKHPSLLSPHHHILSGPQSPLQMPKCEATSNRSELLKVDQQVPKPLQVDFFVTFFR